MGKWDFVKIEFKICLRWISYIAQGPCITGNCCWQWILHTRPVMRRVFQCHNIIMLLLSTHHRCDVDDLLSIFQLELWSFHVAGSTAARYRPRVVLLCQTDMRRGHNHTHRTVHWGSWKGRKLLYLIAATKISLQSKFQINCQSFIFLYLPPDTFWFLHFDVYHFIHFACKNGRGS